MERIPCVYLLASGFHGTLYTGVTSKLLGRTCWKKGSGKVAELIAVSGEGRRLPQYDWQEKP